MTDDELEARLRAALAPPEVAPPAERVVALRDLAEQRRADAASGRRGAAPAPGDPGGPYRPGRGRPARRAPRRSLLGLAAGTVLLIAAATVGRLTAPDDGAGGDLVARGTPEFTARVSDGGVSVEVQGARAPEGRVVVVRSGTLPVIPPGEYYELWFVGPDDADGSPDRVSAGTFHPSYEDGSTLVVLHAAVDPTLFPVLEITAEPDARDPAPSGDVVLTGPLVLLDGS